MTLVGGRIGNYTVERLIGQGAMAPTRMPNGANSRAQVTVFAASAAFAET